MRKKLQVVSERVAFAIRQASAALAVIALGSLLLVVTLGVYSRLFLSASLISGHEELSGFLLIAVVFFGLPAAFHSGTFVRVSIVYERLPTMWKNVISYGLISATIAYAATMTYISVEMTWQNYIIGTVSLRGSNMHLYVPHLWLTLGVGLFLLYLVAEVTSAILRTEASQIRNVGDPQ